MVIRSGSIRAILCVAEGAPLHACTPDRVPSAQVFDLPLIDLSHATSLADSTSCEYFSCDHAADYATTYGTPQDGTGDGVIFPKYAPFNANAEHTTALVEDADHSGAYYCGEEMPGAKEPLCDLEVVDPVLKPIEMPVFDANGEHTTGLAADHSSGYYCKDPDAGCSTTTPDVVLKPIEMPVFDQGDAGQTSILANSTECEYFSCDHSADYIGSTGDQLGDGTIYPAQELAPVAPAAAPAAGKGSQEKPCRPTPGHLLLMGHACVFGALEATGKLVTSGDFDAFVEDFKKSSISGAKAVTPVGGYVLGNALKA